MSKANSTSNFNKNNSPHTNSGNHQSKDLSIWEWEEVNNWLQNNHMQQYQEVFQKYEVNGYDLCYMTNEDLTEMRLTNFHDRNLILRNIRLMTLEQLKIQFTFDEKVYIMQLDFDPNFTAENLVASVMELFKIQTGLVFVCTQDNEVLMPNLKLVDLILLNPKKYKSLKIFSASDIKNTRSENYNAKKQKSYSYEDGNLNAFNTFDKDKDSLSYAPPKNSNNSNNNNNFVTNINKDEDLLLSSKNPLDDYSYSNNNIGNNDYDQNSYKIYGGSSTLKNYENSINNITNKYNANVNHKNMHNETYDELKMLQNKNRIPSDLNFDKDRLERTSYLEDKELAIVTNTLNPGNNKQNNFISITDNFTSNNSRVTYKPEIKNPDPNKDDFKSINLPSTTGTPVQNNSNNSDFAAKYNYSERFRDGDNANNRQRFSSEKRNYRNGNQNLASKSDDKVEDFNNLIKNDKFNENNKFEKFDKFDKFSTRYNNNNPDFNSLYSDKDGKERDRGDRENYNFKDNFPGNKNDDVKKPVNTMRSQLTSFATHKVHVGYKFNQRESNQNSEVESDSNTRKLNRNNSSTYTKMKI